MSKVTIQDLDDFTKGYLECALWSSTAVNDRGELGESLSESYEIEDFHEEALQIAVEDCKDFQESNAKDLEAYYEAIRTSDGNSPQSWAGHDFWLTRNGHGAGFWDRGLGDLGIRLSSAARVYGSWNILPGDDGYLYFLG